MDETRELVTGSGPPSFGLAVLAVMRRELLIFRRYPTWIVGNLVWPILFPFSYIFTCRALAGPQGQGMSAFVSRAGTSDYVTIIVTGTLAWMWLNMMLWFFGTCLRQEQLGGTLETNWLAPQPKWFLLLGASLASVLRWVTFYLSLSYLMLHWLFGFTVRGSMGLMVLVVLASVPSVYGLGCAFASLVLWARETNAAVNVVRGFVMVFAGITYPLSVLPAWMRSVAEIIPLTHFIRACRRVAVGGGWGAVRSDVYFLLVSGAILLAAGCYSFVFTQNLIRQRGALGQH